MLITILNALAVLALSFIIGSIPSGLIVVKIANGKDVRTVASGRTGGTNAMRAAGFLAGLVTMILDVSKGIATLWLVQWIYPGSAWMQVFAAILAILGHNYSIFLEPKTHQLFGYVEIEDEARWNAVASTAVCQRWWKYMGDVMPSNPDNSPVSSGLKEVFHLA